MSGRRTGGLFAASAANFSELLTRDHQRLDAMLASVLELVHADLHPQLEEHWTAFEDGVLAHLDAEEMFIFPELAKQDAAGSDALLAEHARLRALMADIGVGLDLHIIREAQMLELARVLHAHAQAEDATVYQWANTEVAASSRDTLTRRLKRAWDRSWASDPSAPDTSATIPAPKHTRRARART